jgi:Outer membrane protein beta-barrel domain
MKTRNLMVLALSLSFASAYANEEQVLNSAPINVDGYLAEDKPVTDGELEQIRSELNKQKMGTKLNKEKAKDLGKLTNQTEKLLDSQDEYIDQKIESTHAIKEFNNKYEEGQRKLKCIMEELDTEECEPYKNKYKRNRAEKVEADVDVEVQSLRLQQAAPVVSPVVSTAEVSSSAGGNSFETIKLLPYAGGTTYNGEIEQLETELSAGLRLESNLNSRFSVGIGFNYNQLKTNDFANNFGYMSSPFYTNAFGQGREIQHRSMGFDLYGKFFITSSERFRPYIGAGLGYSRANLKYSDDNSAFDPNFAYYYGSEDYNTSFVSGTLMLGSEIMITNGFGINIEGAYSTGLGDSLSSKSAKSAMTSPDQARLKELGEEIINSNALSIFAGAVVKF